MRSEPSLRRFLFGRGDGLEPQHLASPSLSSASPAAYSPFFIPSSSSYSSPQIRSDSPSMSAGAFGCAPSPLHHPPSHHPRGEFRRRRPLHSLSCLGGLIGCDALGTTACRLWAVRVITMIGCCTLLVIFVIVLTVLHPHWGRRYPSPAEDAAGKSRGAAESGPHGIHFNVNGRHTPSPRHHNYNDQHWRPPPYEDPFTDYDYDYSYYDGGDDWGSDSFALFGVGGTEAAVPAAVEGMVACFREGLVAGGRYFDYGGGGGGSDDDAAVVGRSGGGAGRSAPACRALPQALSRDYVPPADPTVVPLLDSIAPEDDDDEEKRGGEESPPSSSSLVASAAHHHAEHVHLRTSPSTHSRWLLDDWRLWEGELPAGRGAREATVAMVAPTPATDEEKGEDEGGGASPSSFHRMLNLSQFATRGGYPLRPPPLSPDHVNSSDGANDVADSLYQLDYFCVDEEDGSLVGFSSAADTSPLDIAPPLRAYDEMGHPLDTRFFHPSNHVGVRLVAPSASASRGLGTTGLLGGGGAHADDWRHVVAASLSAHYTNTTAAAAAIYHDDVTVVTMITPSIFFADDGGDIDDNNNGSVSGSGATLIVPTDGGLVSNPSHTFYRVATAAALRGILAPPASTSPSRSTTSKHGKYSTYSGGGEVGGRMRRHAGITSMLFLSSVDGLVMASAPPPPPPLPHPAVLSAHHDHHHQGDANSSLREAQRKAHMNAPTRTSAASSSRQPSHLSSLLALIPRVLWTEEEEALAMLLRGAEGQAVHPSTASSDPSPHSTPPSPSPSPPHSFLHFTRETVTPQLVATGTGKAIYAMYGALLSAGGYDDGGECEAYRCSRSRRSAAAGHGADADGSDEYAADGGAAALRRLHRRCTTPYSVVPVMTRRPSVSTSSSQHYSRDVWLRSIKLMHREAKRLRRDAFEEGEGEKDAAGARGQQRNFKAAAATATSVVGGEAKRGEIARALGLLRRVGGEEDKRVNNSSIRSRHAHLVLWRERLVAYIRRMDNRNGGNTSSSKVGHHHHHRHHHVMLLVDGYHRALFKALLGAAVHEGTPRRRKMTIKRKKRRHFMCYRKGYLLSVRDAKERTITARYSPPQRGGGDSSSSPTTSLASSPSQQSPAAPTISPTTTAAAQQQQQGGSGRGRLLAVEPASCGAREVLSYVHSAYWRRYGMCEEGAEAEGRGDGGGAGQSYGHPLFSPYSAAAHVARRQLSQLFNTSKALIEEVLLESYIMNGNCSDVDGGADAGRPPEGVGVDRMAKRIAAIQCAYDDALMAYFKRRRVVLGGGGSGHDGGGHGSLARPLRLYIPHRSRQRRAQAHHDVIFSRLMADGFGDYFDVEYREGPQRHTPQPIVGGMSALGMGRGRQPSATDYARQQHSVLSADLIIGVHGADLHAVAYAGGRHGPSSVSSSPTSTTLNNPLTTAPTLASSSSSSSVPLVVEVALRGMDTDNPQLNLGYFAPLAYGRGLGFLRVLGRLVEVRREESGHLDKKRGATSSGGGAPLSPFQLQPPRGKSQFYLSLPATRQLYSTAVCSWLATNAVRLSDAAVREGGGGGGGGGERNGDHGVGDHSYLVPWWCRGGPRPVVEAYLAQRKRECRQENASSSHSASPHTSPRDPSSAPLSFFASRSVPTPYGGLVVPYCPPLHDGTTAAAAVVMGEPIMVGGGNRTHGTSVQLRLPLMTRGLLARLQSACARHIGLVGDEYRHQYPPPSPNTRTEADASAAKSSSESRRDSRFRVEGLQTLLEGSVLLGVRRRRRGGEGGGGMPVSRIAQRLAIIMVGRPSVAAVDGWAHRDGHHRPPHQLIDGGERCTTTTSVNASSLSTLADADGRRFDQCLSAMLTLLLAGGDGANNTDWGPDDGDGSGNGAAPVITAVRPEVVSAILAVRRLLSSTGSSFPLPVATASPSSPEDHRRRYRPLVEWVVAEFRAVVGAPAVGPTYIGVPYLGGGGGAAGEDDLAFASNCSRW